ncbi:PREDICTED: uncharacterized protein LOC105567130 isoform X2 [Vollenhovia emeryi]|uniref:uncharacterized protein LOC105567130 isoform X2 n=1 Tax=Vollenhovia emeryi TaxID=411798 RepID=UPI0005F4C3E4|nr:PREDICTED: uncharacterized protein LOC105567130 isoform X2 [Vollenhovia emeryi]
MSTLTGRDTRRGHGGSSSRRKSGINTRIYAVSYRATEEDTVMDTNSRRERSKNTKACSKNQQLEDIRLEDSNRIEVFPWLPKFNKAICSCAGSRNYQHLERLLSLYTQNVLSSLAKSSVKFSDEINLKNHINKMLIFFHFYWLDIKQDTADHSQYLNKISALLNVYIDLELKTSMEERTSSHVRDSSKIAAKVLAALYIYLNNSEEHIFRVLLRIKHTTEKYTKVCNHIFTKSFTNLKTKTTSITDVAYIRYLLAFKMWIKMEETTEMNLTLKEKKILSDKKERINELALMLLGSRMPELQDELLKFVPRPPMGQENETLWLIQSNRFDIELVRKQFLLFQDKMDNSTGLQCTKTMSADQNCSKSQKHQTNSLFQRSNSKGDTSEQKVKKCLGGFRNNNTLPNNEDKSLDQTYLQKKGSKSLKPLKKIRKKPRKPVIIDLTGDDEISIPCKGKRKKTQRNSECLRFMKKIMKSQKHIKYSGKLVSADVKESNENLKSLGEKIRLECKPIYDSKISDSTENCTSVNTRSSLNDVCYINLQKDKHPNITKNQMNNTCLEFAKEDEKQHDYNSHCLKSPMFVEHDTKKFKVTANVLKESKLENCISSYVTIGNATSSYNNSVTQNKEALTAQEESATETISLFKTCQNNIADQHSFKQELPTSTNYSATQKSHKYWITMPVYAHDINHLIKEFTSIDNHSSQITEIDCKPFILTNNDITATKAQGTLHNTFNDNGTDIKLACDTNIIDTLSDRNKRIYVLNHNDITTVRTEKRMQCLDKSNDTCTVSTTFTEDQTAEPPLYNQHVNFDNVRMNDYDSAAKYSKTTIKEPQKRTDCDSSILNDILPSSKFCTFDINSFDSGSSAEVDYDLKSFLKIEATDETAKTDYVDDVEHINFSHNTQSETFLEDFFRESSEQSQINYDNLIGVPTKKLMYTDNDVTAVKTQDNLHNMFNADENDVKIPYDTNIIYMLSDHDKYIYVTNHTGEHVTTTSAEKRMQYLNTSNNTCTVSTTFTGDQIVKLPLDSQHVNSDNRRKCDYEAVPKYSEDTMKEQKGRSNCDTSMSNKQLHSSELCTDYTSEIDFSERNSKEPSEIIDCIKTDCTIDFENIKDNIQTGALEDILSNDTNNFILPLFEFDNVYTDTSLNEKIVLCNNQNDTIDSSIDLVASHLTTKSDKPMFQGAMEFRYSS